MPGRGEVEAVGGAVQQQQPQDAVVHWGMCNSKTGVLQARMLWEEGEDAGVQGPHGQHAALGGGNLAQCSQHKHGNLLCMQLAVRDWRNIIYMNTTYFVMIFNSRLTKSCKYSFKKNSAGKCFFIHQCFRSYCRTQDLHILVILWIFTCDESSFEIVHCENESLLGYTIPLNFIFVRFIF